MKKVLIIGPDFTPSSLPPALRVRFFAQHLSEFGWQPTVLTVDPQYYEWPVDADNARLVPEDVRLIRTKALPAKFARKVGVGDIALRSLWHHWRAARRMCRADEVDLVFIPMPPNFQAVLGRLMHHSYKVPYVIDYIDPWVSIDYWRLPKERRPLKRNAAYSLARLLEPFVLRRVSHITGVSKGTTDSVVMRYPWLSADDATEIPYGGEEAAFDYLREHPRPNRVFRSDDGLLHVSYVGACNSAMRPTLRAMLSAVRSGLERSPALFERLRLHFVGTTYAPDKGNLQYQVMPLAREAGVERVVDERPGRISYLDALQLLIDSHALMVVGSDAPHYTASKIFPYILAKRPLLVVFHEASSVVGILRETGAGSVVTFNAERPPQERVPEITRALEEILSLPAGYQPPTHWQAFEAYTTRAMAARLARVFDRAVLGERPEPRPDEQAPQTWPSVS